MGCRINPWFAGLPAAVCGRKLEAMKRIGGNPPADLGAGYNRVYTAGRGTWKEQIADPLFFYAFSSAAGFGICLFSTCRMQYHQV